MSSADEGPLTPDFVRWAARRVVAQHESAPPATMTAAAARPGCAQCGDGGCTMLGWARGVLDADR